MSFTRLRLAVVGIALLICLAATAGESGMSILACVRNLEDFYRITDQPYRMSPDVAAACAPAPAPRNPDDPHGNYYCHVYVTKSAGDGIETHQGAYPVGTVFVKQKFSDSEGKKPELFTIMRKMRAGYDDANGNWEYSVINRDGTSILSRGRIESCIDCHKTYAKEDYITREYLPKPVPASAAEKSDARETSARSALKSNSTPRSP